MMSLLKKILMPALLMPVLTGCNHKDLYYDFEPSFNVRVVYDWRNAPDATPASMALYLFDSESAQQPLRFSFTGRDGGLIHIPAKTYHALGINSDINDWAVMGDEYDIDRQGVYTRKTSELSAYGLSANAVPRARGTEDEPIVNTPGMFWTDRVDNLEVQPRTDGDTCVITLYPEEGVSHYTVDFIDVKNLAHIHGNLLDATISGLADGYVTGAAVPSKNSATMPFTLAPQPDGTSLHAEFLTFGVNSESTARHIITVYMYITDGTKWCYTVDVTDQVDKAPDPRHVHIVVKGLDLPTPISGGGGFVPDVNDWNTVHIGLDMGV